MSYSEPVFLPAKSSSGNPSWSGPFWLLCTRPSASAVGIQYQLQGLGMTERQGSLTMQLWPHSLDSIRVHSQDRGAQVQRTSHLMFLLTTEMGYGILKLWLTDVESSAQLRWPMPAQATPCLPRASCGAVKSPSRALLLGLSLSQSAVSLSTQ